MCDFCDEETKSAAQKLAKMTAIELRDMADHYERLAGGWIKPHTDNWIAKRALAGRVISRLVEDWV